jgi:hypothetical protein
MAPHSVMAGAATPAIIESANDCSSINRAAIDPLQLACAWLASRHSIRPALTFRVVVMTRLGGIG